MTSLTETATIAAALRAGMTMAEVRRRFTPNAKASRLLELCEKFGAAPAENLERLANVENAREKSLAELSMAASGPRASAKLVTLLPVVVLIGGQLLGLRIFNNLNPLIIGSIVLGAALLLAGRWWSNQILAKAEPVDVDPGAELDAFASALGAGLSPSLALREVEMVFGFSSAIAQLIELSAETGLAVARLAQAEADRLRLAWRVEADTKIREASVRLMWPLGLAVLPAFVLIAVIPLAAAMLRGA